MALSLTDWLGIVGVALSALIPAAGLWVSTYTRIAVLEGQVAANTEELKTRRDRDHAAVSSLGAGLLAIGAALDRQTDMLEWTRKERDR